MNNIQKYVFAKLASAGGQLSKFMIRNPLAAGKLTSRVMPNTAPKWTAGAAESFATNFEPKAQAQPWYNVVGAGGRPRGEQAYRYAVRSQTPFTPQQKMVQTGRLDLANWLRQNRRTT